MKIPVIEVPFLFKGKWAGFATPFFILVENKLNKEVIYHEECHVKQYWKGLIFFFILDYLYQLYKKGYWFNKYEVEAREYARKKVNEAA